MMPPSEAGTLSALAAALVALAVVLGSLGSDAPHDDEPWTYRFDGPTLQESESPPASASDGWWLDSGGRLEARGPYASTIQGDAPGGDPWRAAYAASNPTDTDDGAHPQNIFRLVTRARWRDLDVRARMYVVADHWSASPNRNASNGLLIMSRYVNGDTLYYAGIRVDGNAVIKKKYQGTYYTLAQRSVFPGGYREPQDDVNRIPHREWLTLRSVTKTLPDGSVHISLYIARDGGPEALVASAVDRGQFGGTPPIPFGRAGLRTDFMDVHFDSFSVSVP